MRCDEVFYLHVCDTVSFAAVHSVSIKTSLLVHTTCNEKGTFWWSFTILFFFAPPRFFVFRFFCCAWLNISKLGQIGIWHKFRLARLNIIQWQNVPYLICNAADGKYKWDRQVALASFHVCSFTWYSSLDEQSRKRWAPDDANWERKRDIASVLLRPRKNIAKVQGRP